MHHKYAQFQVTHVALNSPLLSVAHAMRSATMNQCLARLCSPNFQTSVHSLSPLTLNSGSRTKLCSSCLGLTAGGHPGQVGGLLEGCKGQTSSTLTLQPKDNVELPIRSQEQELKPGTSCFEPTAQTTAPLNRCVCRCTLTFPAD